MDFYAQISALVEKSLKGAAVPAGQTVCWQLQPLAWPPPSGRAAPPARPALVFWLAVTGAPARWCYSVQGMTLSGCLPTQKDIDAVVAAAVADIAAQLAAWKV